MASLDSLKITECPAAFADLARKHNRLIALLETATGAKLSVNNFAFGTIASTDADLTARVAALESTTTTLSSDVSILQGDVSTLQSDVSTLQGDVSALQSNVTTLLTLASGLSRQNITYCSGGVSSTKTIIMS